MTVLSPLDLPPIPKTMKRLTSALLIAFSIAAHAEPVPLFDGKTFTGWEGDTGTVWRIEDGLPQNSVRAIEQTAAVLARMPAAGSQSPSTGSVSGQAILARVSFTTATGGDPMASDSTSSRPRTTGMRSVAK